MKNRKVLLGFVSVLVLGFLVTVRRTQGVTTHWRGDYNDGALNHEDPDWTPSEDGTGYGARGEVGQGLGGPDSRGQG
ncbi:MAG: hypothetical protein ACLFVS_04750 [Candidatus Acetothermia bacterium]